MIRKFNTRLIFNDTDNSCYEIHGKNSQKNVQVQELFDLSNFLKSS